MLHILTAPVSCRVWQRRRVILTKDVISFAFEGDENQIDYIPLAEVEFAKETKIDPQDAENRDVDDLYKMQIATLHTGYNSGRVYSLGSKDHALFLLLLSEITKNAKAARCPAPRARRAAPAPMTLRRHPGARSSEASPPPFAHQSTAPDSIRRTHTASKRVIGGARRRGRYRAESKNLFRMVQLKVRRVYESGPVQGFMAVMIMAVRAPRLVKN